MDREDLERLMPMRMKATCPRCGSKSAQAEPVTEYRYNESGLPNVVLRGGVTRLSCPKCKGKYVSIHSEDQLLQVLAMALITSRPGCLTGPELRYVRQICELTQANLAKLVGFDRYQTILEWEADLNPQREPGREILLRLVLLQAFQGMLAKEGNNHLNPVHLKLLRQFEEAFTAIFMNLLRRTPPRRLSLEKPVDQPWQFLENPPLRGLAVTH